MTGMWRDPKAGCRRRRCKQIWAEAVDCGEEDEDGMSHRGYMGEEELVAGALLFYPRERLPSFWSCDGLLGPTAYPLVLDDTRFHSLTAY